MKAKLVIFFSQILLLSCSSSKPIQEAVVMKQIESDYSTIIRGNLDENRIFSINFPFVFQFENESSKEKKMDIINYYSCKDYGKSYMKLYVETYGGWNRIKDYENIGGSLIRMGANYESRFIKEGEKQEFIIHTNHPIDTIDQVQLELRPYLEQMKMRGTTHGKDTLSIGTFQEFKEKHPELTKTLLEGDSVRFKIFDIDNKLDTIIVLPIKY